MEVWVKDEKLTYRKSLRLSASARDFLSFQKGWGHKYRSRAKSQSRKGKRMEVWVKNEKLT